MASLILPGGLQSPKSTLAKIDITGSLPSDLQIAPAAYTSWETIADVTGRGVILLCGMGHGNTGNCGMRLTIDGIMVNNSAVASRTTGHLTMISGFNISGFHQAMLPFNQGFLFEVNLATAQHYACLRYYTT